ncbi:MAG: hypothetical protein KatS3mg028_0015 [Bacteroidia bacterium]|nr:MAG: hypothetical protein KatS3mg028_0015 [Bacteroidia bacterium]
MSGLSVHQWLFGILSFLAVLFSLMVVFSRSPVNSVLYLIMSFFFYFGNLPAFGRPIFGGRKYCCICRSHHGVVFVRDNADEFKSRYRTAKDGHYENHIGRSRRFVFIGIDRFIERFGRIEQEFLRHIAGRYS